MLVLFTEITYRTVEVVQQLDPSSNREILIDIKVYQTTKPTLSNTMLSQTFFLLHNFYSRSTPLNETFMKISAYKKSL